MHNYLARACFPILILSAAAAPRAESNPVRPTPAMGAPADNPAAIAAAQASGLAMGEGRTSAPGAFRDARRLAEDEEGEYGTRRPNYVGRTVLGISIFLSILATFQVIQALGNIGGC